jgi:hypothetical protein
MFTTSFRSILWCYGEEAAIPKDLETHGIPFRTYAGVPTEWNDEELKLEAPALIVLDDLLEIALKKDSVETLFTKKIHHMNWSVILVSQNLLYQSKTARTISLNCSYFVLFNNFRDKAQFAHFARQLEPQHHRELVKAYNEALSKSYKHFLIDLSVTTPHALRYRSCIFPTEACIFWSTPGNLENLKNEAAIEFA